MRLFPRALVRIITCLIVSVATLELCARIDDRVGYGAPIFSLSYNENRLYEYDQIGKHSRPTCATGNGNSTVWAHAGRS